MNIWQQNISFYEERESSSRQPQLTSFQPRFLFYDHNAPSLPNNHLQICEFHWNMSFSIMLQYRCCKVNSLTMAIRYEINVTPIRPINSTAINTITSGLGQHRLSIKLSTTTNWSQMMRTSVTVALNSNVDHRNPFWYKFLFLQTPLS